MCNRIKSKHPFAVTSAKRVVVFQASLELVRKQAGAHLSNKDNKHSTFHGSKCMCEGDDMNKNDTLIQR